MPVGMAGRSDLAAMRKSAGEQSAGQAFLQGFSSKEIDVIGVPAHEQLPVLRPTGEPEEDVPGIKIRRFGAFHLANGGLEEFGDFGGDFGGRGALPAEPRPCRWRTSPCRKSAGYTFPGAALPNPKAWAPVTSAIFIKSNSLLCY